MPWCTGPALRIPGASLRRSPSPSTFRSRELRHRIGCGLLEAEQHPRLLWAAGAD
jgi:hypothetical protein